MQVELEPGVAEVLAKLRVQASAKQIPFDAYLGQFVEPDLLPPLNGTASLDEFDRILNELTAAAPRVHSLPADFSRADIYADHS